MSHFSEPNHHFDSLTALGMHSVDTYLKITLQCSHEVFRATHFLHQDPATHDAIWLRYLETLIELLMINSQKMPSAKIPPLLFFTLSIFVLVLILVNLEIKAHELAKSSVKLNLSSAVYAQDDSHK
jgi:hypothetical protein